MDLAAKGHIANVQVRAVSHSFLRYTAIVYVLLVRGGLVSYDA